MRMTLADLERLGFDKDGNRLLRKKHEQTTTPIIREAQSPNVERSFFDAPLEAVQGKTLYTGRVSVCIVSHRRRLCDPDGLVGKWFLDAARYACLIREDDAKSITYSISQIKVATKDEEGTEIIITPL